MAYHGFLVPSALARLYVLASLGGEDEEGLRAVEDAGAYGESGAGREALDGARRRVPGGRAREAAGQLQDADAEGVAAGVRVGDEAFRDEPGEEAAGTALLRGEGRRDERVLRGREAELVRHAAGRGGGTRART